MYLEEDGHNVLNGISQLFRQNHVFGIPTPVPGVATSPRVQISGSGIISHENLDFVTKRDFELQMSDLKTVLRNSS